MNSSSATQNTLGRSDSPRLYHKIRVQNKNDSENLADEQTNTHSHYFSIKFHPNLNAKTLTNENQSNQHEKSNEKRNKEPTKEDFNGFGFSYVGTEVSPEYPYNVVYNYIYTLSFIK